MRSMNVIRILNKNKMGKEIVISFISEMKIEQPMKTELLFQNSLSSFDSLVTYYP